MTIPVADAKILDHNNKDAATTPTAPTATAPTDGTAAPFAQALAVFDDPPAATSSAKDDAQERNSVFRAAEYLTEEAGVGASYSNHNNRNARRCVILTGLLTVVLVAIVVGIWVARSQKSNSNDEASWSSAKQLGSSIQGALSYDECGWAVDLNANGTIIAIGSPALHENARSRIGSVRVFERADDWQQVGNTIQGQSGVDEAFGSSLTLSSDGSTLVIGDYLSDDTTEPDVNKTDSGAARVFRLNEADGQWVQAGQDLVGIQADDWAGRSVAVSADGNMVAMGAVEVNPVGRVGYVLVFEWNATASLWQQHGSLLRGEENDGFAFGFDVDLSADGAVLAVGDYRHSNEMTGNNAGQVQVYEWSVSDEDWEVRGAVYGRESSDWFGWSLSLTPDGLTLAVGATQDSVDKGGYAAVYKWDEVAGAWEQIGERIRIAPFREVFGHDVSISSTGILVTSDHRYGLFSSKAEREKNTGRVQAWKFDGAAWESIEQVDGTRQGDFFGRSISVSADGTAFASGAPGNDDNGIGSGHVRVFELN